MLYKVSKPQNILSHPLSNKAHNMGDPSFMPPGMLKLMHKLEGLGSRIGDMNK